MIDLNKLFAEGADEDAIVEAVKRNMAEKKAEEEKKIIEDKAAAEREALLHEARAHVINAVLAYDDVFHFFGDEPVTEDDIAELETVVVALEKMIPVYMKMEEMKAKEWHTDEMDKLMDLLGGFMGF